MSDIKDIKIGVYVQKDNQEEAKKRSQKDKNKKVEFLDKEAQKTFIENMFALPCAANY